MSHMPGVVTITSQHRSSNSNEPQSPNKSHAHFAAHVPLVAQPYLCNIEPIFNQYGTLRIYWPRYNDCILTSCQYRKVVYSIYLAN